MTVYYYQVFAIVQCLCVIQPVTCITGGRLTCGNCGKIGWLKKIFFGMHYKGEIHRFKDVTDRALHAPPYVTSFFFQTQCGFSRRLTMQLLNRSGKLYAK